MKSTSIGLMLAMLVLSAGSAFGIDLQPTQFEIEQQRIQYEFTALSQGMAGDEDEFTEVSTETAVESPKLLKHKSPGKALLLSFAVPGLGQYYYGSKVKSVLFFGAEVAAWTMYFKWQADGDDLTGAYEAFNRTHWSRSDYEDRFLLWTYGVDNDTEVPGEYGEINHTLPETQTQQFFEMTGKYDQFAWGWDDAVLRDSTLDDFSESNPPPRVFGSDVPHSANRLTYENMRNDANNKYGKADNMIIVSIVNRLISGFEAYFTTKSRNKGAQSADTEFGRIKIRTKLKSYYTRHDTPFVQLTYKF